MANGEYIGSNSKIIKNLNMFIGTLSEIKSKETKGQITYLEFLFSTDTKEFYLGSRSGKAICFGTGSAVNEDVIREIVKEASANELQNIKNALSSILSSQITDEIDSLTSGIKDSMKLLNDNQIKIKEKLDSKQDLLIAGDGIRIENDVISVDTTNNNGSEIIELAINGNNGVLETETLSKIQKCINENKHITFSISVSEIGIGNALISNYILNDNVILISKVILGSNNTSFTKDFTILALKISLTDGTYVYGGTDVDPATFAERVHTHTITDITDLNKGMPNGVASLDENGQIPAEQLPENTTSSFSNAYETNFVMSFGMGEESADVGGYISRCTLNTTEEDFLEPKFQQAIKNGNDIVITAETTRTDIDEILTVLPRSFKLTLRNPKTIMGSPEIAIIFIAQCTIPCVYLYQQLTDDTDIFSEIPVNIEIIHIEGNTSCTISYIPIHKGLITGYTGDSINNVAIGKYSYIDGSHTFSGSSVAIGAYSRVNVNGVVSNCGDVAIGGYSEASSQGDGIVSFDGYDENNKAINRYITIKDPKHILFRHEDMSSDKNEINPTNITSYNNDFPGLDSLNDYIFTENNSATATNGIINFTDNKNHKVFMFISNDNTTYYVKKVARNGNELTISLIDDTFSGEGHIWSHK